MEKADLLDPSIIEKRNARYRFVGSVLITLILVFFLPILMDSTPPPRYEKHPIKLIFSPPDAESNEGPSLKKKSSLLGKVIQSFNPFSSKNLNSTNPLRFKLPLNSSRISKYQPTLDSSVVLQSSQNQRKKNVKFFLQFGSFERLAHADAGKAWLDSIGLESFIFKKNKRFILHSGPYASRQLAQQAADRAVSLQKK